MGTAATESVPWLELHVKPEVPHRAGPGGHYTLSEYKNKEQNQPGLSNSYVIKYIAREVGLVFSISVNF